MQVSESVLAVLDRAQVDGPNLVLVGQLDPKDYQAVNKVLVAAGGKWNRSAKAHVFPHPAEDIVDQILTSGEVTNLKSEFGAFYTPPDVVARIRAAAEIKQGDRVLEPSIGDGALAAMALSCGADVVGYDVRTEPALSLRAEASRAEVREGVDFLTVEPEPFDVVVMNPPFAKQQDVAHVTHALKFVPSGTLVAIMTPGYQYRQSKQAQAFRDLLADEPDATVEDLPAHSFRSSGTDVVTVLLTVRRASLGSNGKGGE